MKQMEWSAALSSTRSQREGDEMEYSSCTKMMEIIYTTPDTTPRASGLEQRGGPWRGESGEIEEG